MRPLMRLLSALLCGALASCAADPPPPVAPLPRALPTWPAPRAPTATRITRGQDPSAQQTAEARGIRVTPTAYAGQTNAGTLVAPGEWGGAGISVLVLTDTVQMHFQCDAGYAYVPLRLDATGTFDLPGFYASCPTACRTFPAHFAGQVVGPHVTLSAVWAFEGKVVDRGTVYGHPGADANSAARLSVMTGSHYQSGPCPSQERAIAVAVDSMLQ